MITDEQVAEEIARLTRERDRAEQLAQHRGAELELARRERDEAIAHDRQPYPTAWAYEQACKTIERMRPVVERAQEWRDGFARPAAGPFPRQLALCDAVDAYESEMEAIAAANRSGGDVPVEPAPAAEAGDPSARRCVKCEGLWPYHKLGCDVVAGHHPEVGAASVASADTTKEVDHG